MNLSIYALNSKIKIFEEMQSILSIILPITFLLCFLGYTDFSTEMNFTDRSIVKVKHVNYEVSKLF